MGRDFQTTQHAVARLSRIRPARELDAGEHRRGKSVPATSIVSTGVEHTAVVLSTGERTTIEAGRGGRAAAVVCVGGECAKSNSAAPMLAGVEFVRRANSAKSSDGVLRRFKATAHCRHVRLFVQTVMRRLSF